MGETPEQPPLYIWRKLERQWLVFYCPRVWKVFCLHECRCNADIHTAHAYIGFKMHLCMHVYPPLAKDFPIVRNSIKNKPDLECQVLVYIVYDAYNMT